MDCRAKDHHKREKLYFLQIAAPGKDDIEIWLEFQVYQDLHEQNRYRWLPVTYISSKRILCMPYLGKSLSESFIYLNEAELGFKFSKALFSCIAEIHLAGFCHTNIDPDHIVCDENPEHTALVGFKSAQHKGSKYSENTKYSPIFKARAVHPGVECSFLHDWESSLYVLVYALNHYLPWMTFTKEDEINQEKTKWIQRSRKNSATNRFVCAT